MESHNNYEVEDLLEMLGGDQYYSMDQIMYVYHTLKNEKEESKYYMNILEHKQNALNKKVEKMNKIKSQSMPVLEETNSSSGEFEESKVSDCSSTVFISER